MMPVTAGRARLAHALERGRRAADNLPSVLALRAAQMLVALLIIKLTHFVLSPGDFITFNSVLFSLAVASALFSPAVRELWRSPTPDVAAPVTLLTVGVAAAAFVPVGLVARVTGPDAWSGPALAFLLAGAAYSAAKAYERMVFAYGFARSDHGSAFAVTFWFLAAEAASIIWIVATGEGGLAERLVIPLPIFAAAVALGRRVSVFDAPAKQPGLVGGVALIARRAYLSGNGRGVILYTVALTLAANLERLLPDAASAGAGPTFVKDYLLALAYGIALQSFLSIAVDWARPRMVAGAKLTAGAPASFATCAALVTGGCVAAALLGLGPLQLGHLLPTSIGPGLWALIVMRFSAQIVIMLCQLDLVMAGRTWRATVPWLVLLLAHVAAMGFGGEMGLSLHEVAALVAAATCAMAMAEVLAFAERTRRQRP